jgi:hypothetical protein
MLPALATSSPLRAEGTQFWKKAGNSIVVVDTRDHAVHRVPIAGSAGPKDIEELLRSPQKAASLITCGGIS